jgi:hypothetical protein
MVGNKLLIEVLEENKHGTLEGIKTVRMVETMHWLET